MKTLMTIIVGAAFVGGLSLMQGCVVKERDTVVRDHDHDHDHDAPVVVVHDHDHPDDHHD